MQCNFPSRRVKLQYSFPGLQSWRLDRVMQGCPKSVNDPASFVLTWWRASGPFLTSAMLSPICTDPARLTLLLQSQDPD
jgi:hypothetical protein